MDKSLSKGMCVKTTADEFQTLIFTDAVPLFTALGECQREERKTQVRAVMLDLPWGLFVLTLQWIPPCLPFFQILGRLLGDKGSRQMRRWIEKTGTISSIIRS